VSRSRCNQASPRNRMGHWCCQTSKTATAERRSSSVANIVCGSAVIFTGACEPPLFMENSFVGGYRVQPRGAVLAAATREQVCADSGNVKAVRDQLPATRLIRASRGVR
jgi:hypothetical protein